MSQPPIEQASRRSSRHSSFSVHRSSSSHNATIIPMSSLKKSLLDHNDTLLPFDYSNVSSSIRLQCRALFRRSLSYHHRQLKTNICCMAIWPILVVVLTFIFAMLGADSVDRHLTLRLCVNEADPFNEINFTPFVLSRGIESYIKIVDNKVNVAWFSDDMRSYKKRPCVHWFGDHIPIKHPYENSSLPLQPEPHTYYVPSPAGTWFNLDKVLQDHPLNPSQDGFNQRGRYSRFIGDLGNVQQNVFISYPPHLASAVGHFPNVTANFTTLKDAVWPPTDPSIVYMAPNTTVSSLLGHFPVRYTNRDFDSGQPYDERVPEEAREEFRTSKFFFRPDATSMDATILQMVTRALDLNQRLVKTEEYEGGSPFGGLMIESLDMDKLRVKMTMQMATTISQGEYYGNNDEVPAGLRQMITISQITSSMTKSKFGANLTISQGLRIMPYVWGGKTIPNKSLDLMASALFPFGLAFLLPTLVTLLVQEKEDRHRMMMAMNGLRDTAYYTAHYLEYMCMQLIMCLVFSLAALAIKAPLITRTEPGVLVVLFVVWSHTQTTFAFFLASFFSRARKASLMVYFFVALSCIAGSLGEVIFSNGVPIAWSIHPLFAFFRILQLGIMYASMINNLSPLTFRAISPGTSVFNGLMMMLGESVLLMVLTGYLDAVLPSEYGVTRPWHFPISMWFRSSSSSTPTYDPEALAQADHVKRLSNHNQQSSYDSQRLLVGADTDVYAERDRVESGIYRPDETPLVLHNLFHQYPNKVEPALRGVSFGVPKNQVLGLLGPNGAGKSTMIHLLTGLYTPTAGTAFVAGAEIRKDMTTVHARIGVCPQHDILWDDLTIADHLLFYARLRGIPPALEQQAVDSALAGVSLSELRDRQVVGLSGGEKRRVSIAISLLGDNKVIFLDEPTTGLDPEVRRVVWDVVHHIKKDRTVILTTHSMEEADMLSDRICIMTQGRLRCIGSSLHLKEMYGSGFRLNIYSKAGRLEEACQLVEDNLMVGMEYRRIDKFTNASMFEFQLSREQGREDAGELSSIFHQLNQPTLFPAIEDWSISQATLEDVFIKVVTEGEDAVALPGIVQYTV